MIHINKQNLWYPSAIETLMVLFAGEYQHLAIWTSSDATCWRRKSSRFWRTRRQAQAAKSNWPMRSIRWTKRSAHLRKGLKVPATMSATSSASWQLASTMAWLILKSKTNRRTSLSRLEKNCPEIVKWIMQVYQLQ